MKKSINMDDIDTQNRKRLIACDPMVNRRTWVKAPAGGGKTTFLLSIAKTHPSKQFLLVTFSKALQMDVKQRAWREKVHNITVRTFDSLTYAATGGGDIQSLYPRVIVGAFWPKLGNAWYRKKGGRDIGKVCAQALRCTGTFVPCEYHGQTSVDTYVLPKLWGEHPKLRSHAGNRRTLFEANRALVDENAPYDVIVVDEVQDLDNQALTLLDRCKQPIVYVGDPMQKIYGFSSNFKCKCQFPDGSPPPYFPEEHTVSLYKTFRLNDDTVQYLNDLGLVQMVAHRQDKPLFPGIVLVPTSIHWAFPGLCYMFRSNVEVCKFVQDPDTPVSVRVVGGKDIAHQVESFKFQKNEHNFHPFANFVRSLAKIEREALASELRARHTDGAVCTDGPIACTVHRAKGSECEYAVVERTMLRSLHTEKPSFSQNQEEEIRIAYVAFTRHRSTLFVSNYGTGASEVPDELLQHLDSKTAGFVTNKRKRDDNICFF
jgi:hypothetical protein